MLVKFSMLYRHQKKIMNEKWSAGKPSHEWEEREKMNIFYAYISIFTDFFRLINQTLRNLPQIFILCDKHICQMTTLGGHPHLSRYVIFICRMYKTWWEEWWSGYCRNIMYWHFIEALQIDDKFEKVEKLSHRITIFMWQQ